MDRVIQKGFVGKPHAHLTGRPGLDGRPRPTQKDLPFVAPQIYPTTGAKQWALLHTRALHWNGKDDSEWLAEFRMKVPCGQCRKHWDKQVANTPPEWSNYFNWSVARHNEVNAMLGKPIMGEFEARTRWIA